MPEVRTALSAFNLITAHAMRRIGAGDNALLPRRLPKAGPTSSRFKLRIGIEKDISTDGTVIDPLGVFVPILAAEARSVPD